MCRAFRKPSPSHRQGFEPWCTNQPQFFRDHHHQSYGRPLSITDILNETNNVLHPAEGTSYSSHPFSSEQPFLPNQTVMDKQQLIELPQLDSPTASLALNEQHLNGLTTNEDHCSDERSNNSGQVGIDWKSLDSLFTSQFTDTTNYFSHPHNLPMMVPHGHELQPQNQPNHVLGCFPDL